MIDDLEETPVPAGPGDRPDGFSGGGRFGVVDNGADIDHGDLVDQISRFGNRIPVQVVL